MKAPTYRAHRVPGGDIPPFTAAYRDKLIKIAKRHTIDVDGKPVGWWGEAAKLDLRKYYILLLMYVMDASEREAGEVLGVKQTTVSYQHAQALAVLRQRQSGKNK